MVPKERTSMNKLQLFENDILSRSKQRCSEMICEATAQHDEQLEAEEARIAKQAELSLQQQIAQVEPRLSRRLSKVIRDGRTQLYREREEYLTEMMGEAHRSLCAFAESDAYEQYLIDQIRQVAKQSPLVGITVKMNPRDMKYADRIQEIFGQCEIVSDEAAVTIGGAILFESTHGVMIDLTIDSALAQQKRWLYENAGLIFSETGETD